MMPKLERLKDKYFIDLAFKKRQKLSTKLLSVYYLLKLKDINRFNCGSVDVKSAFIVPLKVDKRSTKRNLVKRRMKEAYRVITVKNILLKGSTIKVLIWVAHPQVKDARFSEIKDAMYMLLSRLVKQGSFIS